jgi:hypothetical protein
MGRQEQKLAQIGGMVDGLRGGPSWLDGLIEDLINGIIDRIGQGPPSNASCPLSTTLPAASHTFSPPYDTPGVGKAREGVFTLPQQSAALRLIGLMETVIEGQGIVAEWRVKLSKGNAPSANVTITAAGSPDE